MNSNPSNMPRLALLLIAASLVSGVAHAERADREKPMNIESDRMSLDDQRKESVFDGNVVLTQGTMILKADRITIKQDAQGFSAGVALGKPAYFRQKREGFEEYIEGYGERLEYDGKSEKLQIFTNARIKRADDEVRGDYISYNAGTEFYEVMGTKGSTTASATGPTQRVKAVIQPKKKAADTPTSAPNK